MYARFGVFTFTILLIPVALFGQHFSFGVLAGTALTDDFNSFYSPAVDGSLPTIVKSGGKGIIVGPMLEWNFTPRFSVEADGLFRELRYEDRFAGAHNPTVTWEFPILAKYRFTSYHGYQQVRPFLEAGPSFRTTGNLNSHPSHAGISVGGGIDFRIHQLNLAPTLRYTRWQEDARPFYSRPDQLELVLGFSHFSHLDRQPLGKLFSLGAILGVNLRGDYDSVSYTSSDALSGSQTTFSARSGSRSFLVGPELDLRLSYKLSVEVDALYRPLREYNTQAFNFTGNPYRYSYESTSITWQFPALVKYKLPPLFLGNRLLPFVEAGPSFRIGSVTHFGFTAGGGVATHLGVLQIAPAVRYTRWQADSFSAPLRTDEVNLLVGFTF